MSFFSSIMSFFSKMSQYNFSSTIYSFKTLSIETFVSILFSSLLQHRISKPWSLLFSSVANDKILQLQSVMLQLYDFIIAILFYCEKYLLLNDLISLLHFLCFVIFLSEKLNLLTFFNNQSPIFIKSLSASFLYTL